MEGLWREEVPGIMLTTFIGTISMLQDRTDSEGKHSGHLQCGSSLAQLDRPCTEDGGL